MSKPADCFIWYQTKIFEIVVICPLCRNKQTGNGFDKIWATRGLNKLTMKRTKLNPL